MCQTLLSQCQVPIAYSDNLHEAWMLWPQLQKTSHFMMDEIAHIGTVICSGKTHHIRQTVDIWSMGCTITKMITGKVSLCSSCASPSGLQVRRMGASCFGLGY